MPKSSKPKKKYVPKAAYPPFRYTADLETMLSLRPYMALETISKGEGTVEDWRTLAIRLNMSEALLFSVFDKDEQGREITLAAMTALAALWERHTSIGKFVLKGEELSHLRDGLSLADELQAKTTRTEQAIAIREVHATNSKLRKKLQAGVTAKV